MAGKRAARSQVALCRMFRRFSVTRPASGPAKPFATHSGRRVIQNLIFCRIQARRLRTAVKMLIAPTGDWSAIARRFTPGSYSARPTGGRYHASPVACARAEGLRSVWLRPAVVLAAVGGAVASSIAGISAGYAVALAMLVGWLIASVLYVTKPVVFGRALGGLAALATALALVLDGGWRWFATLPLGAGVFLLRYRWRHGRDVDAIPRDRTLVPYLFDEGDRLIDTLDAVWGSPRNYGPPQALPPPPRPR